MDRSDRACCGAILRFFRRSLAPQRKRPPRKATVADRIQDMCRHARRVRIGCFRSATIQRAEKELQDAVARGGLDCIEEACRRAAATGVRRSALNRARAQASRLRALGDLRAALDDRSAERVHKACCLARSLGATKDDIMAMKVQHAEQELRVVVNAGGGPRLAVAVKYAQAVGVAKDVIEAVVTDTQRAKSELQLKEALESGALDRIEQACYQLQSMGSQSPLMKHAQAEAARLRLLEEEERLNAKKLCFAPNLCLPGRRAKEA